MHGDHDDDLINFNSNESYRGGFMPKQSQISNTTAKKGQKESVVNRLVQDNNRRNQLKEKLEI